MSDRCVACSKGERMNRRRNCRSIIDMCSLFVLLSLCVSCGRGAAGAAADAPVGGTRNAEQRADWHIYRGGGDLRGVTDARMEPPLQLEWAFATGDSITSSPVVQDGTVFVGSGDGRVYALSLADGEVLWELDTGSPVEAPPLVFDETVYVGSIGGRFYALDAADGSPVWETTVDAQIVGSANVITKSGGIAEEEPGSMVVFGAYDNLVRALDSATGEELWRYESDYFINGTPAVADGMVVFGGCDALLHVVAPETGIGQGSVEIGAYIAGSPAYADGVAYVGDYAGSLTAVRLSAGDADEPAVLWTYPGEQSEEVFYSSPAVGSDVVIVGSRTGVLHAVDRAGGTARWTFQTGGEIDSSPVIAGEMVVFVSFDGYVYILDVETGSRQWSYEIGAGSSGSPAVTDGHVIVGCEDGRLYVFGGAQP